MLNPQAAVGGGSAVVLFRKQLYCAFETSVTSIPPPLGPKDPTVTIVLGAGQVAVPLVPTDV